MDSNEDWFVCPNCGEVLVGDPDHCSRCGADDEAGWTGGEYLDGVELPGEDFDYDDFVEQEFGGGAAPRSTRGRPWLLLALLVLVVALLLSALVW